MSSRSRSRSPAKTAAAAPAGPTTAATATATATKPSAKPAADTAELISRMSLRGKDNTEEEDLNNSSGYAEEDTNNGYGDAEEENGYGDAAEEVQGEEHVADDQVEAAPPAVTGLYEPDFTTGEIDVTLADPNGTVHVVLKFEQMGLSDQILKGVYEMNYNAPSNVQKIALPLLLADPPTNMIAQSRSGTGKTAAFALTMLARCDPNINAPQAICLANARELAVQIESVIRALGKHTSLQTALAVPGGIPPGKRITEQIVVGTPGTVQELMKKRRLDFGNIRVVVLDEADAMVDAQNLGAQSAEIVKGIHMRSRPQMLLFSATFPDRVKRFAASFAPRANLLALALEEVNVTAIHQFFVKVRGDEDKYKTLDNLYGALTVGQSIIFMQRKVTAYAIANRMQEDGHAVSVLTGDDEPQVRDQTMQDFREGKSKVLIATNVLARGIDVPQINLVVNYDLPVHGTGQPDYEAYMHRIGRTGRFGREGVSVNLVDSQRSMDIQNSIAATYMLDIKELAAGPDADLDELMDMLKKVKFE
ncbi:P-loop containing nucleoside triphosphate hydrolase protein [Blastocladiella britannica]|nr:P-loop containing nucleoside triphosphate hydrolase protein [Blastocladiella britannica]